VGIDAATMRRMVFIDETWAKHVLNLSNEPT
jgi:hypothetical protein